MINTLPVNAIKVIFVTLALLTCATAQTRGWGSNQRGKLGVGTFVPFYFSNPMEIPGALDATAISGNTQFTLFLKADGTVYASGDNQLGQLGNFDVDLGESNPVGPVRDFTGSSLSNVTQISAGAGHSAALRSDGTVWVWGLNDRGQFGIGSITTSTSCACIPRAVKSAISNVVQVDAGDRFTLALKADGTVWGWGDNFFGQLGNSTGNSLSPAQVGVDFPGFDNIIAISAGERHAMALRSDGKVWVWGRNVEGQIGNGSFGGNQFRPVQNTTLSDVVQISAGARHNVALKADGSIWTWGLNSQSQAGNGTFDNLATPQQNFSLTNNIVDIEAMGFGAVARLRGGSIWAWGANAQGEMGNGTVMETGCQCQSLPVQASAGTNNALLGSGYSSGFVSNPTFTTTTGANVRRDGRNVFLVSQGVTTAGTTSYTAIDPTTTGLNVPAGYTIEANAGAYNITSTAVSGRNYVCLNASTEYDPAQFALLKILHEEGPNLVDRTVSSVFMKRQVCAETPSFSRFVLAKGTVPTQSLVTVLGRVTTAAGQGLSNAPVTMSDGRGGQRMAITSGFGYYSFDSVLPTENYTIAVQAKRYRSTPQSLTVIGNLEVNFTVQGNSESKEIK